MAETPYLLGPAKDNFIKPIIDMCQDKHETPLALGNKSIPLCHTIINVLRKMIGLKH